MDLFTSIPYLFVTEIIICHSACLNSLAFAVLRKLSLFPHHSDSKQGVKVDLPRIITKLLTATFGRCCTTQTAAVSGAKKAGTSFEGAMAHYLAYAAVTSVLSSFLFIGDLESFSLVSSIWGLWRLFPRKSNLAFLPVNARGPSRPFQGGGSFGERGCFFPPFIFHLIL